MNRWTELHKKHAELIKQFVEKEEAYKARLPKVSNLSAGEELVPWMPTMQELGEMDKLEKEIEAIRKKLQQIRDELTGLQGFNRVQQGERIMSTESYLQRIATSLDKIAKILEKIERNVPKSKY